MCTHISVDKQEVNKPRARNCLSFFIYQLASKDVSAFEYLAPTAVHFINGSSEWSITGFDQLHLRPDIGLHIRAN